MLALRKDNIDLLYKKCKENTEITYVRIFGKSQHFCHWCLDGRYSQHQISASPFTFRGLFYKTHTGKQLPVFMLAFLFVYLSPDIFVVNIRRPNIQYEIILIIRKFLFTTMTKNDCQQLCYNYGYLSSLNWLCSICK